MCIRDSTRTVLIVGAVACSALTLIAVPIPWMWESMRVLGVGAVSYTHLDVYKRQYLYSALFTAQAIVLSVLLGVPFAVFLTIGAHWFHGTSDELYRRVAYIIIAIAGLISLPIFDALR